MATVDKRMVSESINAIRRSDGESCHIDICIIDEDDAKNIHAALILPEGENADTTPLRGVMGVRWTHPGALHAALADKGVSSLSVCVPGYDTLEGGGFYNYMKKVKDGVNAFFKYNARIEQISLLMPSTNVSTTIMIDFINNLGWNNVITSFTLESYSLCDSLITNIADQIKTNMTLKSLSLRLKWCNNNEFGQFNRLLIEAMRENKTLYSIKVETTGDGHKEKELDAELMELLLANAPMTKSASKR